MEPADNITSGKSLDVCALGVFWTLVENIRLMLQILEELRPPILESTWISLDESPSAE